MIVPDESRKVERDSLRQEKFIQFRYRIVKKKNEVGQLSTYYYLILLSFDNSLAEFGIVAALATNYLECN